MKENTKDDITHLSDDELIAEFKRADKKARQWSFAKFSRYNIRDTEILQGLEQKLGYVDVANKMYHMSCGLYKHVNGTIKLAELATINFCHYELDEPKVVNDINADGESGGIQGAFVLIPQRGLHEMTGSVDLASLYPSAIRSMNISPETMIGQFTALYYEPLTPELRQQVENSGFKDIEWATREKKSLEVYAADLIAENSDVEIKLTLNDGETLIGPASKFRKLLLHKKWAVSGYGTVFDQNFKGIVPSILENWYTQRKVYKKKMTEAKDGMFDILKKYDKEASAPEVGSPNNPIEKYTGFGTY